MFSFFFLCTGCFKKKPWEWNWLRFSIGCIGRHKLYLQVVVFFKKWLKIEAHKKTKIFSSESRRSPPSWVTQCLSCWWILHWKCSNNYIKHFRLLLSSCCFTFHVLRVEVFAFLFHLPHSHIVWHRVTVLQSERPETEITAELSSKSTQTRTPTSVVPFVVVVVFVAAVVFALIWKKKKRTNAKMWDSFGFAFSVGPFMWSVNNALIFTRGVDDFTPLLHDRHESTNDALAGLWCRGRSCFRSIWHL